MLKKITLTLAALLCWFSAAVTAEVLQVRPDAPATYTVKQGDTLWDISREHKVTVAQLAKWNGIATELL